VPKTFKVPVYSTKERSGMIWTTLSENPAALPDAGDRTLPLRSLYLDCTADVAIAALGAVGLIPFTSQERIDTIVHRAGETLYAVFAGQDKLLIGVHAISDHRTALHLVISGEPEHYEGSGQRHFLDWALHLRHAIEHPRPAVTARGAAVEAN
jgi:hypothetical protein